MQDEDPSATGGPEHTELLCQLAAGRSIILDFVAELEQAAAEGAGLAPVDLRRRAEAFLDRYRTRARPPVDCVRLHQALLWDERRHHPFERLLVKRFAHLLPKRPGDDGAVGAPPAEAPLSRRLIPGLTVALTKMLGIDHLAILEQAARQLVEDRHAAGEYPIDWAALAADPSARALLDDALITMAPFFADLPRRLHWLCEVINGHLASPPPEDDGRHWILGEPAAARLIGALYADLRSRLATDRAGLEAAFGPESAAALDALDGALAAAGISGCRPGPAPPPDPDG